MTETISNLFLPLTLGHSTLRNRMVMAPMTRSRAHDNGVPGDLAPLYYGQRSTAGLIISEATCISPMAKGYVRIPGVWHDDQVAAWRLVTDEVHSKGGTIFCQLFHSGRISHPKLLPGEAIPVSPSAVRPIGETYTDDGMLPHVTPRALETSEVAGIILEYQNAGKKALEAGFDGVELHCASGYLPEQFLSSKTNTRTDCYGGNLENRLRFVLEVLNALSSVGGSERVGIKISPEMRFNDIDDDNPVETYSELVTHINSLGLAYLHTALFGTPSTDYHSLLRPLFKGPYIAGGGFTKESGAAKLANGEADAIAYGALFLANPDLPQRFNQDAPLNEPDTKTFYSPGPAGYVDYPALTD
jgi:N-ethylmaleimide reductase